MITTFVRVGGCVQSIHAIHTIGLGMLLEHRVPMHQEPVDRGSVTPHTVRRGAFPIGLWIF